MDKFDLKKYLTEGKILKEDTTKYKPFVEGETVLIKSEVYNERRDYAYILESQEEYDFLVDTSVGEFLNAYPEVEVDAFIKDSRMDERTEYSLGNDIDSYNLTPISENKSTTQLNENNGRKFFFAFDSDADEDNEYGQNLVDITNLSEDDKIKKLKTFFFDNFVENIIDNEALRDQIEDNIENGSDKLIQVIPKNGQIYTDDSELDEKFDPNDLPDASANFTFYNWFGQ